MPYKPPPPELHPNVQKLRAVVTTRWKDHAYRPLVISSLQSYYIDTALDNDADTWTVDIGDPEGDYMALQKRDNEVRVNLFGVGHEGLSHMLTGMADEIEFQDGAWNLIGRDLSSLAVDSTVLPHRWSKARAWSIVKAQAHSIGFQNTQLSRTGVVKKTQYTDGSESYWDFWYRLYRQEKMWLWTLPNGTLVGSKLNYGGDPIYFFGDALPNDHAAIQNKLIPVETVVLTKTTQGRIHEVVIYGTRGGQGTGATGFNVVSHDPTISSWVKKVRKVMLDTQSRTPNAARRAGWEEIFEGKVGAVEYKITIPDPGFVVQSNQVARVVINEIGLNREMFVVGSRIQGGPGGFVQEVRLREREMALSARVPTAPKLQTGEPGKGVQASLGSALDSLGIPRGWGDYFIKAAKRYHGVMDYSLFLACLLGICRAETGFQNERENGAPSGGDHLEWYPFKTPDQYSKLPGQVLPTKIFESRSAWEAHFANEPGVHGITRQYGVGPMQLTSVGLKHEADDLLTPGKRDQYAGGRWHPEFNIMIGARALSNCVIGVHAVRDVDIWRAVDAYNRGIAGAISYFNAQGHVSSYAETVRKYVMSDPGYLVQLQAAEQTVKAKNAAKEGWTSPALADSGRPLGVPKVEQIHAFFNSYDPVHATNNEKRKAICYAAYWGWYHQKEMDYLQTRPMRDMAPPPNVPGKSDCSHFATWCYQSANAPNPNGGGSYVSGQGNTSTMLAHGKSVSIAQARPGDLVFYSSPAHVGVYVGNGVLVEMGSDPGPLIVTVTYRSDRIGIRSYL